MTNKKNKFLTFCFSLIPGAGEMYLGFYKMGISLMLLFVTIISTAGLLNLYFAIFFLPVIWFYSFFHVNHLNVLPDDEFYAMEDDWLIHVDRESFVLKDLMEQHQQLIAGILLLFGVSILWNVLTDFTYLFMDFLHLPDYMRQFIYRISHTIPQGVLAFLIIILAVKMIKNKKQSLQSDQYSAIPSAPYVEVKKEESL